MADQNQFLSQLFGAPQQFTPNMLMAQQPDDAATLAKNQALLASLSQAQNPPSPAAAGASVGASIASAPPATEPTESSMPDSDITNAPPTDSQKDPNMDIPAEAATPAAAPQTPAAPDESSPAAVAGAAAGEEAGADPTQVNGFDLTYDDLKKILAKRSDDKALNLMLRGAEQVNQGFAARRGADVKPDENTFKQLDAAANQGVDDFGVKLSNYSAVEQADPKSDISKFARERAGELLHKMNPNFDVRSLDNMSAAQLEKLGLNKNIFGSQTKFQTKNIVNPVTHEIETQVFDQSTGRIISTLGKAGLAYRATTDPVTGRRGLVSGAGGSGFQVIGSAANSSLEKVQQLTDDSNDDTVNNVPQQKQPVTLDQINRASPITYKSITETQKEMIKDPAIKNLRNLNNSVTNIETKLHALDPSDINPDGSVKVDSGLREAFAAQAANISTGGNSKVAEGVIKEFGGAGGLVNKFTRWASGQEGTMTQADIQFFNRFAQKMHNAALSSLSDNVQIYKNRVKQAPNLPYDLSDNDASRLLGINDLMPNKLLQTQAANQDIVKIQGPSGQTVQMSKDNAQKYLAKPGYSLVP